MEKAEVEEDSRPAYPVFPDEVDHGVHRLGLALIHGCAEGHDVSPGLAHRIDEFLAVGPRLACRGP